MAKSTTAAAGDEDGRLLSLVQGWMRERQAALKLELGRLQQQISARKAAALSGGNGSSTKAMVSNDKGEDGQAIWASKAYQSVRDCVTQHGGWVSAAQGRAAL